MRSMNKMGIAVLLSFALTSCSYHSASNASATNSSHSTKKAVKKSVNYASRLPAYYNTGGRKTIVIDPRRHVWGAYDSSGKLVRAGLATAGANWCPDIKRACRTKSGTFSIKSLGSASCKSSKYPLPRGGAPMPYCMFFNGHQGLHGSPASRVIEGNASHGCVRMHVEDARWVRFNFATIGTRVVVKSY